MTPNEQLVQDLLDRLERLESQVFPRRTNSTFNVESGVASWTCGACGIVTYPPTPKVDEHLGEYRDHLLNPLHQQNAGGHP